MPAVETLAGRFVDTSVHVQSVEEALRFWVDVMGFRPVAHSDGTGGRWATVEDARTGQRLCLSEESCGPFAVSIETADLDATLDTLTGAGCEVIDQGANDNSGFHWAFCKDPSGIPLFLGQP